jgi:DME family drug/metabolite transporter
VTAASPPLRSEDPRPDREGGLTPEPGEKPSLTVGPPSSASEKDGVFRARLVILLAAVLWSTGGAFARVFDSPWLGLHEPNLTPFQRAIGRALFAGLVLLPFIRPRDVTFTAHTFWTAVAFTLMNATYLTAQVHGTAGSAVMLQATAPLWIFALTVFVWRERPEPRGFVSLLIGMVGIAALVYGGWNDDKTIPVLMGLISGLFFGLVLVGLRVQREASAIWLTVFNHLFAAVALCPFIFYDPTPRPPQVAMLALYGVVQMGLPYALVAFGARSLGPREAAALILIEPVLNPVWAYLIDPVRERPTVWLLIGGACIIGALMYRYWPTGGDRERLHAQ